METLGDVVTWAMAIAGAILIPYLIIRAWVFPHLRTIGAALGRGLAYIRSNIMSSGDDEDVEIKPDAQPRQQPEAGRSQPIATTNNAVNAELSINTGDADDINSLVNITPSEAREHIRFQAKAEAIADLMNAGVVTNQAKAIETVYHCSRTSSKRPETTFQRAKQLVDHQINPKPLYYDDLRAQIDAEIKAEGVQS